MIESLVLLALGAVMAKVGLMPLQDVLERRQERFDAARAEEIVAEIRRRAEGASRAGG